MAGSLVRLLSIVAGIVSATILVTSAHANVNEFARFLSWFEGEFDNYEQVWQQQLDKEDDALEHIHHIFKRVDSPAIGHIGVLRKAISKRRLR